MADAKITALTELTLMAAADVLPVVDDPAGVPVTKKLTMDNLQASMAANAASVTPVAGDWVRLIDDPSGTPLDKACTLSALQTILVTSKTSTATLAETDYVRVIGTPASTPADKGITLSKMRSEIMDGAFLYGQLDVTANAAGTQTAAPATPTTLQQFDNLGPTSGFTGNTTTGILTASTSGLFWVTIQLSFSGTNSSDWTYELQLDGVSKLTGRRKLGTGGDVGSASLCGLVSAGTAGDWRLRLTPGTAGHGFLLQNGQFAMVRIGE